MPALDRYRGHRTCPTLFAARLPRMVAGQSLKEADANTRCMFSCCFYRSEFTCACAETPLGKTLIARCSPRLVCTRLNPKGKQPRQATSLEDLVKGSGNLPVTAGRKPQPGGALLIWRLRPGARRHMRNRPGWRTQSLFR